MTLSKAIYIIALCNFWLMSLGGATLSAQNITLPIHLIPPQYLAQVNSIVERSDFQFQTTTVPKKVRLTTMETLFSHPRMSAAMWRYCQFQPGFFAFEESPTVFAIDDGRGLTGHLTLLYSAPGHRIYLVRGRAEAGRLKPFAPAVGAQMITSYRYWETANGFETQLETWTALDNRLLGFLAQPFRGYVKGRQDEFIAYINNNIALFGETAEQYPQEFRKKLPDESDLRVWEIFQSLFPSKSS